jgi:predicted dehydrogenase
MASSRLRWGLLSTARINSRLIPALRASRRSSLDAVASRSQDRALAYARQLRIPRAFGSYEAMLADPGIDVVYIPLPNHQHAEWTIRALEAGKHVLCEKPMALSLAQHDAIAEAARSSGRIVAEAFMYRHHPQTLRVKELVDGGHIGRLLGLRGSFRFEMLNDADFRLDPECGGGSLWDIGCYLVDYARFITGQEPVDAFGRKSLGLTGIDEGFFGQLEFPGGVRAQFDCGFRSPFSASFEIVGSSGSIRLDTPFRLGPRSRICLIQRGRARTIRVQRQRPYVGEIEDIADCILLGRAPRIPLSWSRATAAAILALHASADSGRAEPVARLG